jgi:hypothetical protein
VAPVKIFTCNFIFESYFFSVLFLQAMTGKFPDSPRNSGMDEVENANRNGVSMSKLILKEEIETSFTTEDKTTPPPNNQDNGIRADDNVKTVTFETMGEQSSENINHTGEQPVGDTKQTLSVEQTLNDEHILNVEQKVNDEQTLTSDQAFNVEQTLKIDIEETLKVDRTMNSETNLKFDEENSMKYVYDVKS